jgi:hypothetical protein
MTTRRAKWIIWIIAGDGEIDEVYGQLCPNFDFWDKKRSTTMQLGSYVPGIVFNPL